VDVSNAIPIGTDAEFEAWLGAHGASDREVILAIYKKTSGKATVTVDALQEAALCHGWIDSHGQRIDEERWALRFAPRRPGSNWSDLNRERVRRRLSEGRMKPAGIAALPSDL
jgi:uncharacterized protein YdeI (YjbR/CyaY-like superfamily)